MQRKQPSHKGIAQMRYAAGQIVLIGKYPKKNASLRVRWFSIWQVQSRRSLTLENKTRFKGTIPTADRLLEVFAKFF